MATPSSSFVTVVTGANRGLGLEFTRQLLTGEHQQPTIPRDTIVVATTRDPAAAVELLALQAQFPARLDVVKVDVGVEADNVALAAHVDAKYGRADLLILNAGVGSGDSIANFKREDAISIFTTNAVAPAEQAREFAPLLNKTVALKQKDATDDGVPSVRVFFISTTISSLSMMAFGSGCVSYRASKTALNAFVRSFAIDNPQVAVQIQCPGWVQTDMGKSAGGAPPLTPLQSITNVLTRVNELTLANTARGIISNDGQVIPW